MHRGPCLRMCLASLQVFRVPSAHPSTSPIVLLRWPTVYDHGTFRQSCIKFEMLFRTMQLVHAFYPVCLYGKNHHWSVLQEPFPVAKRQTTNLFYDVNRKRTTVTRWSLFLPPVTTTELDHFVFPRFKVNFPSPKPNASAVLLLDPNVFFVRAKKSSHLSLQRHVSLVSGETIILAGRTAQSCFFSPMWTV